MLRHLILLGSSKFDSAVVLTTLSSPAEECRPDLVGIRHASTCPDGQAQGFIQMSSISEIYRFSVLGGSSGECGFSDF
jgi:hypothetical protein